MAARTWVLIAAAVGAGMLLCRLSQSPPAPWKPVLEESGFAYLGAAVDEALGAVEEARQSGASSDLARAATSLRRLQRYYVPMTEVRQLTYDADRRYYLGDAEGALESLGRARGRVLDVAAAGGADLRKSLDEAVFLIDKVVLEVSERRPQVSEKFRELGHRVNLLVLKGELTLAGETFEGDL